MILTIILLKDPRPGFRQYNLVYEHLNKVGDSFIEVSGSIFDYTQENNKGAQDHLDNAKKYEQDADDILENLTQLTYAGIYRATDAFEILRFSSKVDKAIGHSIRSLRKMMMVEENLPTAFKYKLSQYAVVLDILMQTLNETISLIPVKINLAAKQSYQTNFVEELLDEIHKKLWEDINSFSKNISPLSILLLTQVIESLEKAANTLEDAAEIIRLISFKHKF